MTSAAGVGASTASVHEAGPGASPRAALQQLRVRPVPFRIAKELLAREHYLHSMPGGTRLSFGVFVEPRLMGALTLGVGPKLGYRLVEGATPRDCATLVRVWLSDQLPRNSESKVIGVVLRALRRQTSLKFVLAYADPAAGHLGAIYQATGWVYTGLSSAMSLYDLGDGVPRHSRSLGYSLGTHSMEHLRSNGISVRTVPQSPKHRYLYFLDRSWRDRLRVPALRYPKGGSSDECD